MNEPTTAFATDTVDVAPERLWSTIAAVGDVHVWFPDIIAASIVDGDGIGATRRCTMTNGATLVERILEIDHDERRFVYAIDEHPLPATGVVATLHVEAADGGRSRVHWGARFVAADEAREQVQATLRQIYAQGIANLAAHHGAAPVVAR